MLKSWSIQNFKPILDSGNLKLAPVTVLAGRNSSGKSSLIQSILMIAQTLSSRNSDRALLPNGSLVRLGTFEDVLSEQQSHVRTLMVGFELEADQEEKPVATSTKSRAVSGRLNRFRTEFQSVKVSALFRSPSNSGTSNSAIEAAKVDIEHVRLTIVALHNRLSLSNQPLLEETDGQQKFSMDIHKISANKLEEFLQGVSSEYLRLVPYTTNESNYLAVLDSENEASDVLGLAPTLAAFSHFLPTRLIGKYGIEERQKESFSQEITFLLDFLRRNQSIPDNISSIAGFDVNIEIKTKLKKDLDKLCEIGNVQSIFGGKTVKDFLEWYQSLSERNVQKTSFRKAIREIIVKNFSDSFSLEEGSKDALEVVANNIYIEDLEQGIEKITQFFTSKIHYLGPLRADPQSVQGFAPSSELDEVGARGQYAASVYEANQNARIEYFNPLKGNVEKETLKVALNTWVNYLGVANEIRIQVAGQSGVSWQVVHMKGRKALPLTAVGVGISQILPILVMGLLAPGNTFLLVEQPELHLHPVVQARLGDFFMGLAQCRKQCLIETHSENLVSQLRYHIVQAGGQENTNCLIYFVDQDEQGAAKFNPVEISSQGNILNWPDGFFDETMLQEDRITAASLKRRAKKVSNA